MTDEPLPPPGYAPLSELENRALVDAARSCVALARAATGARGPSRVVTLWRRLVTTSRPAPLENVSTLVINALRPMRAVCMSIPPESARLIGVLAAQAILVECLRGDLAGERQYSHHNPQGESE